VHAIRAWLIGNGFVDVHTKEAERLISSYPPEDALEEGRLDKTITSQLALLTDEEYESGMTKLRRDIESAAKTSTELLLSSNLHLYATIGWVSRGHRLIHGPTSH